MSLPYYPIWIVDFVGSILMIIFSFLCVRLANRLRNHSSENVVWTYLLWLSYGLAAFAVSRSIGHVAQRLLTAAGNVTLWNTLQPYSGAINTLTFVIVASITLFFERIWKVYQSIIKDKQSLQETQEKLLFMNRNLENMVADRARELALSERKCRRILEVSRDMILVASENGMVVDLNPAGLEMLGIATHESLSGAISDEKSIGRAEGMSEGQTLNLRLRDFFHREEGWLRLEQEIRTRGYVSNAEVNLKRRDGTPFNALISGAVERNPDGRIDTLHFLVKDISQRKEMEKQLLQADKMASIGQLASGIAHEVNNPLGMILGYTQLLLRQEDPTTQRYADLKIIEKHTRTCKTIVGDLLSFARSTRTKKGVTHIHTAIEDIVSVVRHHFELDGVKIEKEFDPRIPKMVLDEEKIKQVIMNLVMNAKQAIGKNGTIRLRTRYDEALGQGIIRVSDTGCGIEQEYLTRIFDPFFTTKSTGEGTGLGLSVSYGIIKNHGGEILVESEPGKGSTFTLILPAAS
jgi:signal transduction histidine kinase